MKLKRIIKGNVIGKTSIVILCLLASIGLSSCQEDEELNYTQTVESYPYLSLSSDIDLSPTVDLKDLSKEEQKVISQAFSRINIAKKEDGRLYILQNNANDINVSAELFDYFQRICTNSNNTEYSFRKRMKSRCEACGSPTDCVARSLAYATGQNYDEINSWIEENYGNEGVPETEFYSVMNHFCDNGREVPLNEFSNMTIEADENKKYIIVISNSHAVNLTLKKGDIMYWDEQNGTEGFCPTSDITHVYEISEEN